MKLRPPSQTPTIEDVLDEPPSLNSPSLNLVSNPGITQFARSDDEDLEEDDQIDGMDEEDDDLPDEGGDAPSQPGPSGGAYDEYANMPFCNSDISRFYGKQAIGEERDRKSVVKGKKR